MIILNRVIIMNDINQLSQQTKKEKLINMLSNKDKEISDIKKDGEISELLLLTNQVNQLEKQCMELHTMVVEIKSQSKKKIEYKRLFSYPSSSFMIMLRSNHTQFKHTFKEYVKLHKFLIDIDYEPYVHSDKKDIVEYLDDYYHYVSIYLTFQSYINNLIHAETIFTCSLNPCYKNKTLYGITVDSKDNFTIMFEHNYNVYIKYYVCSKSSRYPELHKHNYYILDSNDCTAYGKTLRRR